MPDSSVWDITKAVGSAVGAVVSLVESFSKRDKTNVLGWGSGIVAVFFGAWLVFTIQIAFIFGGATALLAGMYLLEQRGHLSVVRFVGVLVGVGGGGVTAYASMRFNNPPEVAVSCGLLGVGLSVVVYAWTKQSEYTMAAREGNNSRQEGSAPDERAGGVTDDEQRALSVPAGEPKVAWRFEVERIEKDVQFNRTGEGRWEERWYSLTPRGTEFKQLTFPCHYSFKCPGVDVEPIEIETIGGSHNAYLGDVHGPHVKSLDGQSTLAIHHAQVFVKGYFRPAHDSVSFRLSMFFNKMFCMNEKEVTGLFGPGGWESVFVTPLGPTGSVELTVSFPQSFREEAVRPKPIATYDWSDNVHSGETERVVEEESFSFDEERVVARLEVDNPWCGVEYGVAWEPPAEDHS